MLPSDFLKILVCPSCRQSLQNVTRCENCGIDFSEDTGTPRLLANTTRRVTIVFDSARSVMTNSFRKAFAYPQTCGSVSSDCPYHLDLAHQSILMSVPSGSKVLEIGCGGGQMREYLRSRSIEYVGTDISKTRVSEVLRRHGGPDVLCDAHFLPFQDGVFDVVYSAAVTEHLACPYLVAQEVYRTLKPGGYYLGNVSFMEPWHDDSFFHMSPLGVHEFLSQAGFEIQNLWPGKGYTGYRAMMRMGNKATKALSWIGDGVSVLYNSGNRLRTWVRKSEANKTSRSIEDAAKIAGAIDWIAVRPCDNRTN